MKTMFYRACQVRLLSAVFAAAMLLGGCSLAVPRQEAEKKDDQMIGAYITQEVLECEGTPASGQRIDATVEKNGSGEPVDWSISFPGSDGIRFFAPFWQIQDGQSYRDNIVDDQICERNFSVSHTDEGEAIGLTGTIYVTPMERPSGEGFHFYVNPVYQKPDGGIYATPGSGYLLQAAGEPVEGEQVTAALSEESSRTEDGKTTAEKINVTINFQTMYRPVSITVCQMDAGHSLLKKQAYQPAEVPDKLRAHKNAAYMIVETIKESPSGKKQVSREIFEYTKGQEGVLESFCAIESGLVVKKDTQLVWNTKNIEQIFEKNVYTF